MLKILVVFIVSSVLCGCDKAAKSNNEPANTSVAASVTALTLKKDQVRRGQGLYQALKSVSIDNSQALKLINELRDEVEFSKIKVGDRLEATFDANDDLVKFSFAQNTVETHIVTLDKESKKWEYALKTLNTTWEPRILEGSLKPGSTLESDLLAEGLSRGLVSEIINVLSCKVNFRTNARKGDIYKIVLNERKHKGKIVSTNVLYTSYNGRRAGQHESFYYVDGEKSSTYTAHYTESGQALISSGLRYPTAKLHVRSGYGWRRHPVTGRRAMHRGVDLRARHGAKVHAVAAGRVVVSTFNKYAGNKIGIKHRDGSISYYFHLSRRGVKVGTWVRSHQVIGRVGATGRVTGPHLHFGFKKPNGKWMNPLNKRMIATPKLKGLRFSKLSLQVAEIKEIIINLEATDEMMRFLSFNDFFKTIENEPGYILAL